MVVTGVFRHHNVNVATCLEPSELNNLKLLSKNMQDDIHLHILKAIHHTTSIFINITICKQLIIVITERYSFELYITWVFTHYSVSGGPIMRTSHLYISLSSIKPAEKPSTGFLFSSEIKKRFKRHSFYKRQCTDRKIMDI